MQTVTCFCVVKMFSLFRVEKWKRDIIEIINHLARRKLFIILIDCSVPFPAPYISEKKNSTPDNEAFKYIPFLIRVAKALASRTDRNIDSSLRNSM